MTIINGEYSITYGMTAGGAMYARYHKPGSSLIRQTKDPERYLRWIIQSEVDAEIQAWLAEMNKKHQERKKRNDE